MECLALVFSTESSTVTWWWREATGNATQVVSGGGTVISTEVLGPDQLKSVLSIEVVDTTHDGVYVCVVNTGYNKLTADLLLLLEKGEWHTNGGCLRYKYHSIFCVTSTRICCMHIPQDSFSSTNFTRCGLSKSLSNCSKHD